MDALDFDLETAIEQENTRVANPSLVVRAWSLALSWPPLASGFWPTANDRRPRTISGYCRIEAAIATAAIAAVSARRMVFPNDAAAHPADARRSPVNRRHVIG